MLASNVKPLLARPEPLWLMNVQAEDDFPLHLALTNSLYYPACGLDGDPIRYLGGYIHSFVYTDYAVPQELISASLVDPKHRLKGYRLLFSKSVSEMVFPKHWGSVTDMPKGVRWAAIRALKQPLGYALWAVLERLDEFRIDHGPRRLSLLFIGGEAVEVFKVLYMDNGVMPDVIAIIHCGVGRGHVCSDLAGRNLPFAHNVLDLCERQPQFVLYGVRATMCSKCCWPEFTRRVARWRDDDGELGLWWNPGSGEQWNSEPT
jgi:hypothetical protein